MWGLSNVEGFTEQHILDLHHLFYHLIDEAKAGRYRDIEVFVSGSKYPFPKPVEVDLLMKNFVQKWQEEEKIFRPLETSAFVHQKFVFNSSFC